VAFPPLRSESDDLLHLDLLRFVAAAAIVFHHASPAMFGGFVPAIGLAVDCFFLISGFVIAHVYAHRVGTLAEYRSFIRRRIARLMPLHLLSLALVWAVMSAAIAFGFSDGAGYDRSVRCIAATALLIHPLCDATPLNFPSWSIGAEMAMYLAFPALALLRRNAIIAGLLIAAALVLSYDDWLQIPGALRALPTFLVGLGLFFHGVRQPRPGALVRRLAPLGQLTYSVYMLHWTVLAVLLTGVGQRLLALPRPAMIALGLGCFGVVVALAYLSFVFVELPARRWLNRLGGTGGHRFPRPAGTPVLTRL
jgi:peptidoglycan/LPS O-acetylase OafA/YrhL